MSITPCILTVQTAQHSSFLVVPSSPRDLALEPVSTDPTQLSASWTPPEPANGIIMKYTLYCSRSDDQPYPEQMADESCSLESCSLESNGDALSTVVMGLTAYTNYDCNITATTGAGEGSMSPTMTRRTNESCKLYPDAFTRNTHVQWASHQVYASPTRPVQLYVRMSINDIPDCDRTYIMKNRSSFRASN